MSTKLTGQFYNLANQIEQITMVYLYAARFDAAFRLLNDQVLDLIKAENHLAEWMKLQHQRARILRYQGYCEYNPARYDEALSILKEVLHVAETLGDEALLADTLDLTGAVLQSKEGSLDTSFETRLAYFQRALAIRIEIQDQRGMAESHFHLGLVYQNQRPAAEDNQQQALVAFKKAYHLAAEGDFAFERAHAARHLAYIHDKRQEPEQAYQLHQEFLTTNQTISFKPYLAPAHTMMGLANFRCGNLVAAEQHLQSAYAIADQISSDHFRADAAMMLGVVSGAQGEHESAKEYFDEALALAEPLNLSRVMHVAQRELEKLSTQETSPPNPT